MTPEERARGTIDELLRCASWDVQDRQAMNLFDPNQPGVAVREAHLRTCASPSCSKSLAGGRGGSRTAPYCEPPLP